MIKAVYYFFIGLVLACEVSVTAAVEISASEAQVLESASFDEAYKALIFKYIIYIENPKHLDPPVGELRRDLYEQASYFFAKNPQVREYYEGFFKTTPHTISTAAQRHKVFRDLNGLKAEWAIRLLAQEMMIDRQGQDLNNDPDPPLTIDEVVARISAGRAGDFLRNDRRSASILLELKLRGMPGYDYSTGQDLFLEKMRKWYLENEHQLDKLIDEKWGDKAVLNKDKAPAAMQPKKHPSRRPIRRSDADEEDRLEDKEEVSILFSWKFVLAGGLVFCALIVWLKIRHCARKGARDS